MTFGQYGLKNLNVWIVFRLTVITEIKVSFSESFEVILKILFSDLISMVLSFLSYWCHILLIYYKNMHSYVIKIKWFFTGQIFNLWISKIYRFKSSIYKQKCRLLDLNLIWFIGVYLNYLCILFQKDLKLILFSWMWRKSSEMVRERGKVSSKCFYWVFDELGVNNFNKYIIRAMTSHKKSE